MCLQTVDNPKPTEEACESRGKGRRWVKLTEGDLGTAQKITVNKTSSPRGTSFVRQGLAVLNSSHEVDCITKAKILQRRRSPSTL